MKLPGAWAMASASVAALGLVILAAGADGAEPRRSQVASTPTPTPVVAMSPIPLDRPAQVCLVVQAATDNLTPGAFEDAIARGAVVVLAVVPCTEEQAAAAPSLAPAPSVAAPSVTPSPVPTATPKPEVAWSSSDGPVEYRWASDAVLEVRSSRPCPGGLEVTLNDDDLTTKKLEYPKAGRVVRLKVSQDDVDQFDPVFLADCLKPPVRITLRGSGSDDRFVRVPYLDTANGVFTARATSSFGCITAVYIDGEEVEEFDLFYDGYQTKVRRADMSYYFVGGRTHFKVISSCPWTLSITGRR